MTYKSNTLLRILLPGILMTVAYCGNAHAALTCNAWATSMQFGSVDMNSGSAATSSGQFGYSCNSGDQSTRALLCFSVAQEPTRPGYTPRYMPILHSVLSGYFVGYTLYSDVARTTAIGSIDAGGSAPPLTLNLTVPANTGLTNTVPIYGDIKPEGQNSYMGGQNYGHTSPITLSYMAYTGATPSCQSARMSTAPATLYVGASLTNTCRIESATNLNFGSVDGVLDHNVDSNSTITVTCTQNTSFKVGLNDGLNPSGTTRRMRGTAGYIPYELYQDASRSTRWGNDSSSWIQTAGVGTPQTLTVYGRVRPQTMPGGGNYQDTIVVTVTY